MSNYKYCWGYEKDDMCNFADSVEKCINEAKKDKRRRIVYIGEQEGYNGNMQDFYVVYDAELYDIETGRKLIPIGIG